MQSLFFFLVDQQICENFEIINKILNFIENMHMSPQNLGENFHKVFTYTREAHHMDSTYITRARTAEIHPKRIDSSAFRIMIFEAY